MVLTPCPDNLCISYPWAASPSAACPRPFTPLVRPPYPSLRLAHDRCFCVGQDFAGTAAIHAFLLLTTLYPEIDSDARTLRLGIINPRTW